MGEIMKHSLKRNNRFLEAEVEPIFKPRTLSPQNLPILKTLGKVEGGIFTLGRSWKGHTLKKPVPIPLKRILAVGQRGLVEYIIASLASERPKLIPFVLENTSLIELARYFLRYMSASPKSLYVYVDCIWRYAIRNEKSPDELISDIKKSDAALKANRVQVHVKALEDYVAELQDSGLAPCRVSNYVKSIKTLYRVNGVSINLPFPLSRRSVGGDRAPKPEELARLLEVGDLREKVIISMLALGGFREGTLVRLKYRHVRHDLENGTIPVHIHIESEITKGKYHNYDTFLGADAAEYLKLYLHSRQRGSPDGKMPPEEFNDVSPLIRDSQSKVPRPIGEKQVYKIAHNLYFKAGLLRPDDVRGYDLKVHSLRKFFKTQLTALGVQREYIDYMMGHTIDTYQDVQMKGIEFLRQIYAASNLAIRPKVQLSALEQLKVLARGLGLDPERCIVKGALSEPHRAYVTGEELESTQVRTLSMAIKELIKEEILADHQLPSLLCQRQGGAAGGIRTRAAGFSRPFMGSLSPLAA